MGHDTAKRDTLNALRGLCLALPETSERLSDGEPAWFVQGRRAFVMYADHHHDDRLAICCAGAPEEQQARIASNPEQFFLPPYVGGRGWLGVHLDIPAVDWDEIAEVIVDAYRAVASRRLLARLDAPEPV